MERVKEHMFSAEVRSWCELRRDRLRFKFLGVDLEFVELHVLELTSLHTSDIKADEDDK